MNWFYSENGRQVGPVDDAAIGDLVRRGVIAGSTLVWRQGMAAWLPYQEVWATAGGGASGGGATALAAGQGVRCVECGQVFAPDEVVSINGLPVCARCKPVALQKLREGISPVLMLHYGGFWMRFGAKLLDGLILLPVQIIQWIAIYYFFPQQFTAHPNPAVTGLSYVFNIGFNLAYATFFNGRFGGTPGKLICGLRIVRPDGTVLTYGRAAGRYFAEMLSGLTLGIGYLIAAFDEQKRALHDYIADTRVVYQDSLPGGQPLRPGTPGAQPFAL